MEWVEKDNSLQKTFVFADFAGAIAWMVKASFLIEKMNHHPEWYNIYNKVHVVLRTHDAGNVVTDKDLKLATLLDQV
jgi:4a-hydroxytetrahydrobiopterin dehydratase